MKVTVQRAITLWWFTSLASTVRAVFYLDITDSDVERASELVVEALHYLERHAEEPHPASSAQY